MTANTELVKHQTRNGAPERLVVPPADIYETPEAYLVILDLPGASKESITVTLERHELKVKASVPSRHAENTSVLLSEMDATGYERSFNLGDGIDRDTVDAEFSLGVLTVRFSKSEDRKRKEITVH